MSFYGSPLGVHGIDLGPGMNGNPNKACWYTGSYKQIAQRKEYAVGVTGFVEVLD